MTENKQQDCHVDTKHPKMSPQDQEDQEFAMCKWKSLPRFKPTTLKYASKPYTDMANSYFKLYEDYKSLIKYHNTDVFNAYTNLARDYDNYKALNNHSVTNDSNCSEYDEFSGKLSLLTSETNKIINNLRQENRHILDTRHQIQTELRKFSKELTEMRKYLIHNPPLQAPKLPNLGNLLSPQPNPFPSSGSQPVSQPSTNTIPPRNIVDGTTSFNMPPTSSYPTMAPTISPTFYPSAMPFPTIYNTFPYQVGWFVPYIPPIPPPTFIPQYPAFPIPGVTNTNDTTWINKGREYKKKHPNNIQNMENTFSIN